VSKSQKVEEVERSIYSFIENHRIPDKILTLRKNCHMFAYKGFYSGQELSSGFYTIMNNTTKGIETKLQYKSII